MIDNTALIERLLDQGFKWPYEDADELRYTVSRLGTFGGDFGFMVTVKVRDLDGHVEPQFALSLPHQCDSWDVVVGELVHAPSFGYNLSAFASELARARTVLAEAMFGAEPCGEISSLDGAPCIQPGLHVVLGEWHKDTGGTSWNVTVQA